MKKLTKRQKRIAVANLIYYSVRGMFYFGWFALYGSVGALEVGRIEFHQFIVQCILSIALVIFSDYAYYKIYLEEDDKDEFNYC